MAVFTGTFDCKLDAKGRVMLPVDLRIQLGHTEQQRFIVKRSVFRPCLEFYPMNEWNLLMEKLSKLNRFVKQNADFIRQFTSGVATVDVDSLGRILIPKGLLDFSGISKDVVLTASVTIIEAWDKAKYEEALNEFSPSEFSKLAEQVMGNLGDNVS